MHCRYPRSRKPRPGFRVVNPEAKIGAEHVSVWTAIFLDAARKHLDGQPAQASKPQTRKKAA